MKSVLRKAGRFFAADKKRRNIFLLNCLKQPVRRSGRPSSVNEVDSFPPRGSLDVRQGFTFLPKKMKFAEFFFRQGEAAKRQTIFASLCAGTMRQGEALGQGRRFLMFCNRKNRVKESRSKKRAPLIRRRTATPGCRSCLKRQFSKKSPRGGRLK